LGMPSTSILSVAGGSYSILPHCQWYSFGETTIQFTSGPGTSTSLGFIVPDFVIHLTCAITLPWFGPALAA
jgi:hypothetical protein